VAYTATGVTDLGATPFGAREPLVQLHAAALNDFRANRYLWTPPAWVEAGLGSSLALFGWAASRCTRKRSLTFLWIGSLGLGGVAGLYAFFRWGLVLPVVTIATLWSVASIAELARRHSQEWRERFKLKTTLGLYFSPGVIDHVLARPGALEPQEAQLTVLLSDVRNFTTLTECSTPPEVYHLLNQVFSIQTRCVHSRNGNLEHFYGDLFAAYWGAPSPEPHPSDQAIAAAFEIIPRLEALRETLPPKFKTLFGYGIALHVGPAVVGNVGGRERLDYMVLGDVVNTAARIESQTKYYGTLLLVSRQFLNGLSKPIPARLVDRVVLKGKTEPMELWEPRHSCSPAHFESLRASYAQAWSLYEAGRFPEAGARWSALAETYSDTASHVLAQRCQDLGASAPPDWRGTYTLGFK